MSSTHCSFVNNAIFVVFPLQLAFTKMGLRSLCRKANKQLMQQN